MAPMVAKANISCGSQMASPQPKGSRNKRKFRADPPSDDAEKSIPSAQSECYEFCAEKFEAMVGHGLASACDLCGITQGHSDDLKLDLGLSTAVGSSEVEPSQPKEELVPEESHDADWSDLTESQLEELVLNNLDAIFRSAIKKIVGSGYAEEAATKAVLRSSIWPVPSVPSARNPQSETTNSISGVARITKSMKSGTLHGLVSVKEGSTSAFDPVDKPFSIAGPSKSIVLEEKFTVSRKVHSGSTKREFILRQKTLHLEKSYRTYGSKGSLRSGKLSGLGNLIFEKKPKSVSDSTAANVKNASARISKATVVDSPQDGANQSLPSNSGPSPSSVSFVLETPSSVSSSPNPNVTPARWQQEEKAKEDLLQQASALRKERENIDASTKSKEEAIKSKAEINLQKYKNDIQKLENEISQIRLKVDSSKIAALRMGVDAADVKSNNQAWSSYVSQVFADNISNDEELKRERECVMCLSEEMSVVFLPCAHQVVCTNCNELHEKQGMKDCPSCRCPIKRRVPVRSARSSSS
ncbi:Putative E3 ubiquitin-protein ligase RF298 [Linum perenne]